MAMFVTCWHVFGTAPLSPYCVFIGFDSALKVYKISIVAVPIWSSGSDQIETGQNVMKAKPFSGRNHTSAEAKF